MNCIDKHIKLSKKDKKEIKCPLCSVNLKPNSKRVRILFSPLVIVESGKSSTVQNELKISQQKEKNLQNQIEQLKNHLEREKQKTKQLTTTKYFDFSPFFFFFTHFFYFFVN